MTFKAVAPNQLSHTKNLSNPFKTHYPCETNTEKLWRCSEHTTLWCQSLSWRHNSERLLLSRPGPKTIKKWWIAGSEMSGLTAAAGSPSCTWSFTISICTTTDQTKKCRFSLQGQSHNIRWPFLFCIGFHLLLSVHVWCTSKSLSIQ